MRISLKRWELLQHNMIQALEEKFLFFLENDLLNGLDHEFLLSHCNYTFQIRASYKILSVLKECRPMYMLLECLPNAAGPMDATTSKPQDLKDPTCG